jgi:hypothetical protein
MRPTLSASLFRRPLRLSPGSARFTSTKSTTAESAQKNAANAWEGAKKFLGFVGDKAGSLLGCESSRTCLGIDGSGLTTGLF